MTCTLTKAKGKIHHKCFPGNIPKCSELLFLKLVQFNCYHRSLCYYWQKQPPEVFYEKVVLKKFAKVTGKHMYQSVYFNKVAGSACNLIKKRFWQRCFPVNFAKFLRIPFLQNTSARLLLYWTQLFCLFSDQIMLLFSTLCRSSYWRCFIKKGVLKNFTKFTGKQPYHFKHFRS